MQNLIKKMKELQEREFSVGTSRGSLALQQTQRNQAKAEILDALYADAKEALEEEGFNVYRTHYGPVVELLNPHVEKQVLRMDKEEICSGFITIQLDAIMKNLDTNAELDEKTFLHEEEQKELRRKEREEAKRKKIQHDAEVRAEKARRREKEMARLQRERD